MALAIYLIAIGHPMNDWTPPEKPHENHPKFPFHLTKRNPVKGGKPKLGKKRPALRNAKPTTAKQQFEAMCARLLKLIDHFNDATMKCKMVAAGTRQQIDGARKKYDAAVAALNQFMGRRASNPGYRQFVKPGSFKIEVVLSYGFVVGARIFGCPLMAMEAASSEDPFGRRPGDGPITSDSGFSSCYSTYPPP